MTNLILTSTFLPLYARVINNLELGIGHFGRMALNIINWCLDS